MSETRAVKVQRRDGLIEECSLEIGEVPPWKIVFSGVGLQSREFSGEDLFEALISLRSVLEDMGVQLLCAGARRDVFPSGMSRDMSRGRKAYVTRLGSPALRTDLVDIFDGSDAKAVGSVAEQKAFHEGWVASLRK